MKKRNFAIKLGVTLLATLGLGGAFLVNGDQANADTGRMKITLKLDGQEKTVPLNVEKTKNGIFLGNNITSALRDQGFRGVTVDSQINQQKGTCSVNLVKWKSNRAHFNELKPIVQIKTENDAFELGEFLGKGSEAYVFALKDDPTKVVRIPLKGFVAEFKDKADKLQGILGTQKHPGLVQMFGIGEITVDYNSSKAKIKAGTPCQIMERCSHSLFEGHEAINVLTNKSLKEIIKIFRDLLQGIKSLADLKYIHHDVKGDNILIKTNGHACLADFGLIQEIGAKRSCNGSPSYMSPENINDGEEAVGQDIYSLGMTMIFSLSTGANDNDNLFNQFSGELGANKGTVDSVRYALFLIGQQKKQYIDAKGNLYKSLSDQGINKALLRLVVAMTEAEIDQRPTVEQCLTALNQIEENPEINPETLDLTPPKVEEAPEAVAEPIAPVVSPTTEKSATPESTTETESADGAPEAKNDESEKYKDVQLGIEITGIERIGKTEKYKITYKKINDHVCNENTYVCALNAVLTGMISKISDKTVADIKQITVKNYDESGSEQQQVLDPKMSLTDLTQSGLLKINSIISFDIEQ